MTWRKSFRWHSGWTQIKHLTRSATVPKQQASASYETFSTRRWHRILSFHTVGWKISRWCQVARKTWFTTLRHTRIQTRTCDEESTSNIFTNVCYVAVLLIDHDFRFLTPYFSTHVVASNMIFYVVLKNSFHFRSSRSESLPDCASNSKRNVCVLWLRLSSDGLLIINIFPFFLRFDPIITHEAVDHVIFSDLVYKILLHRSDHLKTTLWFIWFRSRMSPPTNHMRCRIDTFWKTLFNILLWYVRIWREWSVVSRSKSSLPSERFASY